MEIFQPHKILRNIPPKRFSPKIVSYFKLKFTWQLEIHQSSSDFIKTRFIPEKVSPCYRRSFDEQVRISHWRWKFRNYSAKTNPRQKSGHNTLKVSPSYFHTSLNIHNLRWITIRSLTYCHCHLWVKGHVVFYSFANVRKMFVKCNLFSKLLLSRFKTNCHNRSYLGNGLK